VSENSLETHLRYYGISPWEIEVVYSYLNARFSISLLLMKNFSTGSNLNDGRKSKPFLKK
jgi:hypothetical protein